MRYLITVKLDKNPAHDPANKVTGPCPLTPHLTCTDVTGQHHTVVHTSGDTVEEVKEWWERLDYHVTRIEEVPA